MDGRTSQYRVYHKDFVLKYLSYLKSFRFDFLLSEVGLIIVTTYTGIL